MVICLERGADLRMAQLMPCMATLSLAPVKSRLVLPFWYRLSWVFPEKGPLNVCVCVCVCVCACVRARARVRACVRACNTEVQYMPIWLWHAVNNSHIVPELNQWQNSINFWYYLSILLPKISWKFVHSFLGSPADEKNVNLRQSLASVWSSR